MKDVIIGLCKGGEGRNNPEFFLLLKGEETSPTSFFTAFPWKQLVLIYKPFLCLFDVCVNLFRG